MNDSDYFITGKGLIILVTLTSTSLLKCFKTITWFHIMLETDVSRQQHHRTTRYYVKQQVSFDSYYQIQKLVCAWCVLQQNYDYNLSSKILPLCLLKLSLMLLISSLSKCTKFSGRWRTLRLQLNPYLMRHSHLSWNFKELRTLFWRQHNNLSLLNNSSCRTI